MVTNELVDHLCDGLRRQGRFGVHFAAPQRGADPVWHCSYYGEDVDGKFCCAIGLFGTRKQASAWQRLGLSTSRIAQLISKTTPFQISPGDLSIIRWAHDQLALKSNYRRNFREGIANFRANLSLQFNLASDK